jgi:FtsP/CotA-like multicopper oxidase with cupredoxin domain
MSQPENHFHVQATVGAHGSVTLDQLPYQPGQRVDVTISPVEAPPVASGRYPLAGVKVEYQDPYGGVAEGDWEAAR